MRKIFWGICAIIGILGAISVHGSLMVVEQEGSDMLPTIEPGQKVPVYLLEKDFHKGDIVAFEPPYYTIGGGNNVALLRISDIKKDTFILTCDAPLTSETSVRVNREDIIGKAVFYG